MPKVPLHMQDIDACCLCFRASDCLSLVCLAVVCLSCKLTLTQLTRLDCLGPQHGKTAYLLTVHELGRPRSCLHPLRGDGQAGRIGRIVVGRWLHSLIHTYLGILLTAYLPTWPFNWHAAIERGPVGLPEVPGNAIGQYLAVSLLCAQAPRRGLLLYWARPSHLASLGLLPSRGGRMMTCSVPRIRHIRLAELNVVRLAVTF